MNSKNKRGLYLAIGFVIMLFAGIIYAWSILKAPLADEFGWEQRKLGLNFTIMMWCFCIGGIVGGIISEKIKPGITIFIFSFVTFLGFFLAAHMKLGNIIELYLSYGVLCGLSIGIIYNIVISTVTAWFPDRCNTATGVLMMGFGTSSLILGSIAGRLFTYMSWRTVFFILGMASLIVFIAGSFFLKKPENVATQKKVNEKESDYTVARMMQESTFWKFYIYMISLSSIGSCVISFAKDISISVGLKESSAIVMVGVLSLFNGAGRIISGALFDMIGRKKTLFIGSFAAVLSTLLLLVSTLVANSVLNIVGLIVVGLSYGIMPPICSGFVRSMYGESNFSLNFSIANTMLLFSPMSAVVGGWIVDRTQSYAVVFIMLICCALVGLGMNLSLWKKI